MTARRGYTLSILVLFLFGLLIAAIIISYAFGLLSLPEQKVIRVEATLCGQVLTVLNDGDSDIVFNVEAVLDNGTTIPVTTTPITLTPGEYVTITLDQPYTTIVLTGENIGQKPVIQNECK